jgi:hypothetical protein
MHDRLVQIIAPLIMVIALVACGTLLPSMLKQSDESVLRYTNVSVRGAPPFVVLGTTIGAVRGLIVDYLWIKANAMKEKGLFYEAMTDADLITKLQPRFTAVWAFHGHNMIYNISVATNTQQERWEWVNAGIRLVRDRGLRYNPNDLWLHRELAFWFAHKIEGVSDDAHFYYKRELCREWHLLLGQPPEDHLRRIEWIKEIAEAPETITAAEQRTPGVANLVERLRETYPSEQTRLKFTLDRQFLTEYTLWQAIKQQSAAAKILGYEQKIREQSVYFDSFDALASDPDLQPMWKTLIAHVRKRVLRDEYNMDPALMHRYTVELGPIDWRHGSAHALYWARRGSEFGKGRLSDYDIYISLNNDSQQITAMQDLARSGRITYDLFSVTDMPGRFPEPRWIDVVGEQFHVFYEKHFNIRGGGVDRFVTFLQNFMGSAICEWYRAGETERAQKLMTMMNNLFGVPNTPLFNNKYQKDLDLFVRDETYDQYQAQPHLAPRDVSASLGYGFKVGVLYGRPELLYQSLRFADTVTTFFHKNNWNDYTTKFGEGRIADILGDLDESADLTYLQMIVDPSIKMLDRMTIWAGTDRVEMEVIRRDATLLKRNTPLFRALVYDRAMPILQQQFQADEMGQQMTFVEAFPPPPGLDAAREFLTKRQQAREQKMEEIKKRDPMSRSN